MTGPRHVNLLVRREPHAVAVVLVLAILIGVGVLARSDHSAPALSAPVAPVASAAPADAQSSSWYCTGAAGVGVGQGSVYLTNTTDRRIDGTVSVTSDAGKVATKTVELRPRQELSEVPSSIQSGGWLATRADFEAGGVVVTQAVGNQSVWAEAPCASVTSPSWYFASGSTMGGSLLFISLFNPTQTTAVADLTFITPAGVQVPAPFEGLILGPGQLVVAEINVYVQSQKTVSTIVTARSGRIVADELQAYSVNGVQGASLRLGVPRVEQNWALPRSVDATGGDTTIAVFNPTQAPQQVAVSVELPSGPVAPLVEVVEPEQTWQLDASTESRIPAGSEFASVVHASGPGVVVDRVAQTQSSAPAPQWGSVSAVAGSTSAVASRVWVLPGPGVSGAPAVQDAEPLDLSLQNLTGSTVVVHLSVLTAKKTVALATRRIAPHSFSVVDPNVLVYAAENPIVVRASGAVALYEDELPAGMPGVVALAAVPLG